MPHMEIFGASGSSSVTLAALAAAQPFPVELPENNGALGNGKLVTDAAIESGKKIVKSPSKLFATAIVGQYIAICAAGNQAKVEEKAPEVAKEQHNALTTVITKVTSSEEIEIETAAEHTVVGALALFATDDTVAIQTAINNAVSKAQAGAGYCEVWFSQKTYGIAGELKTGGITEGNAQITLPVIESTSAGTAAQGQKITLNLRGSSDSSALPQWYQKVPQQAGALLFSFGPRATGETKLANSHAQPAYSTVNGRPSMLGGPAPEKGYENLKYSNMMPIITGLTISAPSNSTMTGVELNGVSNASIVSLGSYALGIPGLVGEAYANGVNQFVIPWAGLEGEFGAHLRPATALGMPGRGNNDNSFLGTHSAEGHTCGLESGEHAWHSAVRAIYCLIGMTATQTSYEHASSFGYVSIEACQFGIYTPNTGGFTWSITLLDFEENAIFDVYDPNNKLHGQIFLFSKAIPPAVKGGLTCKFVMLNNAAGKIEVPPTAAELEAGYTNKYFRDIVISIVNAEKIEIDAALQLIPAAGAATTVILPSGKEIKVTKIAGKTIESKWTLL